MSIRKLSLIATLAMAPVSRLAAQPHTLTVHADRPAHKVPKSLYGIFFEEINHAGDGGLYAELIRNRGFQEPPAGDSIPGWSLRLEQTKGTIKIEHADPDAGPHRQYLAAEIDTGGTATLLNGGFWGIPIRKGETYLLRFDAKRDRDLDERVTVAIESRDGTTHVSRQIAGITEQWGRFEAEFVSPVDDADARLSFTIPARASSGKFWLDTVSLFPKHTWKDRRYGLRADLGAMVAQLSPNFVRFPGGCFVEGGDFLKDAFRWPHTLGDIADRPGHHNAVWNYWSSDGLGYHEYLQWCEDLNAHAMFVVNCGLSHKEAVPLDRLQPWVDEALNAIEYALGPIDSKFGAMRAAAGHPTPFKLKYVEIGNENGLWTGFGGTREAYTERYIRFYESIKAKYPAITTISNTRVNAPMEMVDDHFYNNPAWFWANAGLYDKSDRTGPKIYVGEYAVTSGCGTGNLAAALAEAAFMIGMERNSDIVTMSSYAPMFVHARDRKWNPDMIVFDNSRAYGTPSYHVQALFANNRPDTLLPVSVPVINLEPTITTGSIGLGTWNTSAEFKDVTVERNGEVVYRSNFDNGTPHWNAHAGDWTAAQGCYRQSRIAEKCFSLLDAPPLSESSDYTLTLKARKLSGQEGFLILFRAKGGENYTWWNIGGWNNKEHAIEKNDGGNRSEIGRHVPGSIETGRWYDIRIELAGKNVTCFLDGKSIHAESEKSAPALAATAGRIDATGEIILKVVNGSAAPTRLRLEMPGVDNLAPSATVTLLTSASMNDENSFEHPDAIVPQSFELGADQFLDHEYPARSLTIARFRPQR